MEGTFKVEAMPPAFIHKKYHPYFQCVMDITEPGVHDTVNDSMYLRRYFRQWTMDNDKKNMNFETFEKCIRAVYGSTEYTLKKFENL
jgi:hypothetical protein